MKETFLLKVLIFAMFACGCKRQSTPAQNHPTTVEAQGAGLFEATSAESQQRLGALPQVGSENMAHLLKPTPLPHLPPSNEFGPDASVDWIIRIKLQQPTKAKAIAPLFDQSWRKIHGGLTIYGRDVAQGKWTYLISSNGPDLVDELQFAWNYHEPWARDPKPVSTGVYEKRLLAVEDQLSQLTQVVSIGSSSSAVEAEARGRRLEEIVERLDAEIWVRLAAPTNQRFKGRDIWDVMLCLGLEWGDMDCFHLNHDGEPLFSVQTTTAPGYFLPEEIVAGRVNVEDLLFVFSLPRTSAPEAVFENMLAAAEYARKRLGGTITSEDGSPLDIGATRQRIRSSSAELSKEGFPPGSGSALRLF